MSTWVLGARVKRVSKEHRRQLQLYPRSILGIGSAQNYQHGLVRHGDMDKMSGAYLLIEAQPLLDLIPAACSQRIQSPQRD